MDFSRIIRYGRTGEYQMGFWFIRGFVVVKYFSYKKSYDELLTYYILSDITNNEIGFLKNGIIEMNDTLNVIKKVSIKNPNERQINLKNDALSILNYELIQFKIKLSAFGIELVFRDQHIEFIEGTSRQNPKYNTSAIEINPYPHIFKDSKSYRIFEYLHNQYKNSNTPLADYSFIYGVMYKNRHILEHFKPEMFRRWIENEPFNIDLKSFLKTYDRSQPLLKMPIYEAAVLSVE